MTRSWIRGATIAGAVVVVALVGTAALALDDTTQLVGAQDSRQHNTAARMLVIKSVNGPVVPAPGPDPEEPPRKTPQGAAVDIGGKLTPPGTGSGMDGGGVSLTASVSPQTRLEMSLKDLARELR